jgi:hypothetical protein
LGLRTSSWHWTALPPHALVSVGACVTSSTVHGWPLPGAPITAMSPVWNAPPMLTWMLLPVASACTGAAASGREPLPPVKTIASDAALVPPSTMRAGISRAPSATIVDPLYAFQVGQIGWPFA